MARAPAPVVGEPWTSRVPPSAPWSLPRLDSGPGAWTATRRPRGRLGATAAWIASAGAWSVVWLLMAVLVPSVALGWVPVVVTSGSMGPTIAPGDVVLSDPSAAVATGDVVTVRRPRGLVTHRVVEVGAEGLRTRGDANRVDDSGWVSTTEVVGRGRLLVPMVGLPLAWTGDVLPWPGRASAALTSATQNAGSTLSVGTVDAATSLGAQFSCGLLGIGAGIRVTWTPPTSPLVTELRLQRSTNGGAWSTLATLTGGTSQYDDFAVALSTTYEYRVVSLTGTAWTRTSGVVSVTTPLICLL